MNGPEAIALLATRIPRGTGSMSMLSSPAHKLASDSPAEESAMT